MIFHTFTHWTTAVFCVVRYSISPLSFMQKYNPRLRFFLKLSDQVFLKLSDQGSPVKLVKNENNKLPQKGFFFFLISFLGWDFHWEILWDFQVDQNFQKKYQKMKTKNKLFSTQKGSFWVIFPHKRVILIFFFFCSLSNLVKPEQRYM